MKTLTRPRSLGFATLLALAAFAQASPAFAGEEPPPSSADLAASAGEILQRMEIRNSRTVWDLVPALEALGENAADVVAKGLQSSNPAVRLACAKVLYEFDAGDPAPLAALLKEADTETAGMAAEILGRYGSAEETRILLQGLEQSGFVLVRIACAKALASLNPDNRRAKAFLSDMLGSPEPAASEEAALALAEIDESGLGTAMVEKISDEATQRGWLARSLLRRKVLREAVESRSAPEGDPSQEVADLVKSSYAYSHGYLKGKKADIDADFLRDAAALGMINSLDPFSDYMTDEEFREDRRRAQGQYAGIGAFVVMREFNEDGAEPPPWQEPVRVITIDRPIYDPPAPAYNAGLRSGDRIIAYFSEEKGDWVSIVGWSLEKCVEKLKGPVGTTVRIRVRRHGSREPIEIVIKRQMITVKAALGEMLPGNVGYIQLRRFDNKSASDFEEALSALIKAGMTSLVVDLRGNPGGTMREVVSIIDMFIEKNLLITYTKGTAEGWNNQYMSRLKPLTDVPLAVLIRSDSASGSEMLSGALKAHGRAVIVGERSYGKGSGQTWFQIESSKGKRWLRLTIFKYYLPDHTSIHEKGVEPNILQEPERIESWQYDWNVHLYRAGLFENWAKEQYHDNKDVFRKLVRFDSFSWKEYPGFDDLFVRAVRILFESRKKWTRAKRFPGFDEFLAQHDTPADRDYIRSLARSMVRRVVQDELAQPFIQDFQEDVQLQRAIKEALGKAGASLSDVPEYRGLVGKFD